MSVAILTDSNAGITQSEAKELGIFVLPMPFTINGEEFYEDINLTQDEFYNKLTGNAEIFTSQPAAGDVTIKFDEILKDFDELVHIPMSSGLSGSCQTSMMLSQDEKYEGKVFVVDDQRVSVTQKQDVFLAKKLADAGKSGKEIQEFLMQHKMEATIYITVNTLDYLKKGGRLTPAAAALGSLLKIKPVLSIQGEKLDSFQKARTMAKAKSIMIDAVKADIASHNDKEENWEIMVAYTQDQDAAKDLVTQVSEAFPNNTITICDPLSLSVSCHIGPGALAVAACKKY